MRLDNFDFRVYDKENKCYIENYDYLAIARDLNGSLYILDVSKKGGIDEFKGSQYELELFTGFYDKFGNKIYENDVLVDEPNNKMLYIIKDNYDTYNYKFRVLIYLLGDNGTKKMSKFNNKDISILETNQSNKTMVVIRNTHEEN